MRLFNRRKEMEFDDPRLVGMSPLKTTEENFGQQNQNLPTLKVERRGEGLSLTDNKSNDRQTDKHIIPNGGASTWRRVARPWDSLRRAESTEAIGRSAVMSSTINRRKTLHFYSELDDKPNDEVLPRVPHSAQVPSPPQTDTLPTKRKIGRVESLRMLLSKSNRIYRGKQTTNNSKIDKGTDTEDLENDIDSSLFNYPDENDEVFHSKYSSFSSLKSGSCFLSNSTTDKNIRRRLEITKTISCENLSLKPENQGITLPGHKDMSTSTSPLSGISYLSQTNSLETTNPVKRSSFPYAYIRSRLTSLQEEPKPSPVKSTTLSRDDQNIQSQDQKQKCSLASKFMHKGFYHSMGNLLSESKEESNRSPGEDDIEEDVGNSEGVSRIFDPLKQIRIDLLHRNPSELDDQSPSPTFWGRRSYSIGDILEKPKGSKDGVEESGYDSDSTRNGHESPRNSIKLQSSSENEHEPDQSPQVQSCSNINNESLTNQPAFDSQSQSSTESSSSSSGSSSTYLFPATGCLITINQSPNERTNVITNNVPLNQTKSDPGKADNADYYSVSSSGAHESEDGKCLAQPVIINYKRSSENGLEVKSNRLANGEKSRTSIELTEAFMNYPTPSIRTEMTDSHKQTAPSLRLRNKVRDRDREWNVSRPSRSKSLCLSIFTVAFNKGLRKKSLGFSVIGGKDSPVPGIFVKRIFPYGQASEEGGLTEGDEILSVNGHPLANSTHAEALQIFKSIKTGDVVLEVARREFLPTNSQNLKRQFSQLSSKSCEQLNRAY